MKLSIGAGSCTVWCLIPHFVQSSSRRDDQRYRQGEEYYEDEGNGGNFLLGKDSHDYFLAKIQNNQVKQVNASEPTEHFQLLLPAAKEESRPRPEQSSLHRCPTADR